MRWKKEGFEWLGNDTKTGVRAMYNGLECKESYLTGSIVVLYVLLLALGAQTLLVEGK